MDWKLEGLVNGGMTARDTTGVYRVVCGLSKGQVRSTGGVTQQYDYFGLLFCFTGPSIWKDHYVGV